MQPEAQQETSLKTDRTNLTQYEIYLWMTDMQRIRWQNAV